MAIFKNLSLGIMIVCTAAFGALCTSCSSDTDEDILNKQTGSVPVYYVNMYASEDTPIDYSLNKTIGIIRIPKEGGTYTFHLSEEAARESQTFREPISNMKWTFDEAAEVINQGTVLPDDFINLSNKEFQPIFDAESYHDGYWSKNGFEYHRPDDQSFSLTFPKNTTGRERQYVFETLPRDFMDFYVDIPYSLMVCQAK